MLIINWLLMLWRRRSDASNLACIPEIMAISAQEGRTIKVHFLNHNAPDNFPLRFNPSMAKISCLESMIKDNYTTLGQFKSDNDLDYIIATFRESVWNKSGAATRFANRMGLSRIYFCVGDIVQMDDQFFLLDSKSQIQNLNETYNIGTKQWAEPCSLV